MVLPEDPKPNQPSRSQPRAALIGVTILVLAVGVISLGSLTTPDSPAESVSSTTTEPPIALPTTTTAPPDPNTFRIVDIQQGHQLWWGRGFIPPETTMDPILIAEMDGEILLFGTPQGWTYLNGSGGVRLWVSADGTFWSDQGEVIGPEHLVTRMLHDDEQIIALTQGGELLTSDNGRSWSSEKLPLPPEAEAHETAMLWNAAAGANRTVVFGQVAVDTLALMRNYLPDDAAALIAAGYGWGYGGNGHVSIQGPWGITIRTVDLKEEGAPEELIDALSGVGMHSRSFVWVRDGDGPWRVAEFEPVSGDWVETVHISDDGTLDAYGFGSLPYHWTSSDGLSWDANARPENPENVTVWGDGYLGTRQAPTDLLLSDDGVSWEDVGVGDNFPAGFRWWVGPIVASDEGIAAFISGQRPGQGRQVSEVSVERDGYRLTANHFDGRIELARVEDNVSFFRFSLWSSVVSDDIAVDVTSRTYTFNDPSSGEALVTFDFDEMEAAEREAGLFGLDPDRTLTGLFYSRDGLDWTIQDITEWFAGERIAAALVTNDRVIAVTTVGEPWAPGTTDVNIRIGIIQRRDDAASG